MGFIAMGMENGTITVWDLQRGVVRVVLGKGMHLAAITDISFSADGLGIFSASIEKDVIEWDLTVS